MKITIIVGRCTKDAILETRKVGRDGKEHKVVNFNVATNKRVIDREKTTAEKTAWKQVAEYTQVTLWDRYAESLAPYLQKGRLISLVGDYQADTWMNRDNQVLPLIKMVNPEIELLDGQKKTSEEPAPTISETEEDDLPFAE